MTILPYLAGSLEFGMHKFDTMLFHCLVGVLFHYGGFVSSWFDEYGGFWIYIVSAMASTDNWGMPPK